MARRYWDPELETMPWDEVLAWQAARVATEDPADCLHKFRSNRAVGWLLLAGIVAGHFG